MTSGTAEKPKLFENLAGLTAELNTAFNALCLACLEIPPAELRDFAIANGWEPLEPYGAHGIVYTHPTRQEIVIPTHANIADYPRVVFNLVQVFAQVIPQQEPGR